MHAGREMGMHVFVMLLRAKWRSFKVMQSSRSINEWKAIWALRGVDWEKPRRETPWHLCFQEPSQCHLPHQQSQWWASCLLTHVKLFDQYSRPLAIIGSGEGHVHNWVYWFNPEVICSLLLRGLKRGDENRLAHPIALDQNLFSHLALKSSVVDLQHAWRILEKNSSRLIFLSSNLLQDYRMLDS